jgi:hypothetical protein
MRSQFLECFQNFRQQRIEGSSFLSSLFIESNTGKPQYRKIRCNLPKKSANPFGDLAGTLAGTSGCAAEMFQDVN